MNYRSFGSTGLCVSEIGFGGSHLGKSIFTKNESDPIRLLHRAFESGINFYDTADIYSYGRSEEIIGKAFTHKRDQVMIATKTGRIHSISERISRFLLPSLQHVRHLQPVRGILKRTLKPWYIFTAAYIKKSVEQSLRRLRTDYIDLYQLHGPSPQVIENGEVFEVLDSLKSQGKIRFYGVSAGTLSEALLCLNYTNVSSLQINFNLLERQAEKELLPLAEKKKVAIIARVPFARGLLTEKKNVHIDLYLDRNKFNREKRQAGKFSFLEKQGSRTLSQAALKFILSHPQITVVIPGTKTLRHLEENISAINTPDLTKEELEKIELI